MGKLTPTRHPYLFGGGISGALIAGAIFAFVSMVAVISQTDLPGSTSLVSTPPHGNLTIGAGQGIVSEHGGGSGSPAPFALAVPTSAVTAPPTVLAGAAPTAATGRTEGSRGAPGGAGGVTGGTNGGTGAGLRHGGPTSANPGQSGQLPAPGERPSGPGPDQAAPTAGPPGLAKKPGGLPPGLAKRPGGLPPGPAKKPGGLPPGLAKRPGAASPRPGEEARRSAAGAHAMIGCGSSRSSRPQGVIADRDDAR